MLPDADYWKLVTAIAAAVASLLVALVSAGVALAAQRMTRSTQNQVETLRADLAQRAKEKDAARDYEYAARKRLYSECEPILFRFGEACDAAQRRIQRLRAAESAGLDLKPDGRDRLSTFYRLMAPIVEFSILRDRLTAFDLGLDRRVYARYLLGRLYMDAISDDADLASREPARPYEPGGRPKLLGRADPAVYLRQGIPPEDLEQLVEAMTCGSGPSVRVVSLPSFRHGMQNKGALKDIGLRLVPLVHAFQPATRPVLWRVLSVQHALLTLMARVSAGSVRAGDLVWSDDLLPAMSMSDEQIAAGSACKSYLEPRLAGLRNTLKGCELAEEATT